MITLEDDENLNHSINKLDKTYRMDVKDIKRWNALFCINDNTRYSTPIDSINESICDIIKYFQFK